MSEYGHVGARVWTRLLRIKVGFITCMVMAAAAVCFMSVPSSAQGTTGRTEPRPGVPTPEVVGPPAPPEAPAPAETATPLTPLKSDVPTRVIGVSRVVVAGASSWASNTDVLDAGTLRVRLRLEGETLRLADPGPEGASSPVRSLADWIKSHSDEGGKSLVDVAVIDRLVEAAIPDDSDQSRALTALRARPVARWLFEAHGIDLGDQLIARIEGERQRWTLDESTGLVTIRIPPPGPGVLDVRGGDDGVSLRSDARTGMGSDAARFSEIAFVRYSPSSEAGPRAETKPPDIDAFEGVPSEVLSREDALSVRLDLFETEQGLIAARAGMPGSRVRSFSLRELAESQRPCLASALDAYAVALSDLFLSRGYRGIVIGRVRGDDRDLFTGKDGVGVLRYRVLFGRVGQVRTIERSSADAEPLIDAASNAAIVERSPVRGGELVNQAAIDDFVFRLNRSPVRRVDVALSAQEDGAVAVDYLVTKVKPWTLFTQLSNTGTKQTTNLRERFGFAHYNLTGVDDTLLLDYTTGNFQEVHALFASYERPFSFDSAYRWRVYGSFSRYDASEVGLGSAQFDGRTAGGGFEFAGRFLQKRALFAEWVAGARAESVEVNNNFGVDAENQFLLPYIGVRAEARTEAFDLSASFFAEFSAPEIIDTDPDVIDDLGRFDTDTTWEVLRGDLSGSVFLEQLFFPEVLARGRGTLANEMFASFRGFAALGDRLPPNYAETAGGFYSVRGYPEAFAVGDRVFIGTLEYRFHVPRAVDAYSDLNSPPGTFLGRPFNWRPPRPLARPDWDLVLRAFLDGALVASNQPSAFEDEAGLLSTGIGAELVLGRGFTARLDWGIPLRSYDNGSRSIDPGESRVHFVITLIF